MNLPQFTAEHALYRTTNVYQEYFPISSFENIEMTYGETFLHPAGGPIIRPGGGQGPINDCEVCYLKGLSCCGSACFDLETDSNNCGDCGNVCPSNSPCCNGNCIPSPYAHSHGAFNYIIGSSDANTLNGLSSPNNKLTATFQVGDADLVGDSGFSIQMNATAQQTFPSSAKNAGENVWIQYIFFIEGTTIQPNLQYASGSGECFTLANGDCNSACNPSFQCNQGWNGNNFKLPSLPNNTLPANYQLELVLSTDNNGNVNGADFWVYDENGNPSPDSPQSIPSPNLWPYQMTELTTNLVCDGGGCFTSFTQGNGTTQVNGNAISYKSNNSSLCFTGQQGQTSEQSNVSYGSLSSCCTTPGSFFSQSFIIPNCNPECGQGSECLLVNGSPSCVSNSNNCPPCGSNSVCALVNGYFKCVPEFMIIPWFPRYPFLNSGIDPYYGY